MYQAVTTEDTRELYKAVGKGHLHDYEMRACKRDAARYREHFAQYGRRPGGWGVHFMVTPQTIVDHYRLANFEEYQTDKRKFWCGLWHRFPDFRSSNDKKCPCCGRG